MKASIIIAVLNSHEVVNRQLRHFKGIIPNNCEVIIIDDGSEPSITFNEKIDYRLKLFATHDERPWSQPCARNRGAEIAQSEYVLMTDIDHVFSEEAINAVVNFNGDKMVFPRQWAVLSDEGKIIQDPEVLFEYGLDTELYKQRGLHAGQHANTFAMKKILYDMLGGYKESFCGKYGGDDTDFARRYGELHYKGLAKRHVHGPAIYVYPNPRKDVKGLFHKLRFK